MIKYVRKEVVIVKSRIHSYKKSIAVILTAKYQISEFEARKWIAAYDFDHVLKTCNYIALHDDPEIWADAIYHWIHGEEDLLQM